MVCFLGFALLPLPKVLVLLVSCCWSLVWFRFGFVFCRSKLIVFVFFFYVVILENSIHSCVNDCFSVREKTERARTKFSIEHEYQVKHECQARVFRVNRLQIIKHRQILFFFELVGAFEKNQIVKYKRMDKQIGVLIYFNKRSQTFKGGSFEFVESILLVRIVINFFGVRVCWVRSVFFSQ